MGGNLRHSYGMNKEEHGRRLREAMASTGKSRTDVADVLGANVKTVTNWRSGSTMPSAADRELLRRLFPGYDAAGDPVEVALRGSELVEWRQDAVLSTYKRNLHEQRGETAV